MSHFLIIPETLKLIDPATLYHLAISTTNENIYLDDTDFIINKYQNILRENIGQNELLVSFLHILSTKKFDYKILKNKQNLNFESLENYLLLLSTTLTERNLVICEEDNFISSFNTIKNLGIQIIEYKDLKETLNTKLVIEDFDYVKRKLFQSLCSIIEQKFSLKYENLYNTFLTTTLNCMLLGDAFDQTLIGTSGSEDSSGQGELDIYVRQKSGLPLTIIEAMKLGSFGKDNKKIAEHLKKLLINYNPVGLKNNIFIVFYELNNFNEAWEKYIEYIENIDNKEIFINFAPTCNLISIENNQSLDTSIQNLKIATSLHTYEENTFEVSHFFVNVST